MAYRVLRLIEYTYPSVEEAEKDMLRWEIPANGGMGFSGGKIVRSSIIQHTIPNEDKEEMKGHKHSASCDGVIGELLCGKEEGS